MQLFSVFKLVAIVALSAPGLAKPIDIPDETSLTARDVDLAQGGVAQVHEAVSRGSIDDAQQEGEGKKPEVVARDVKPSTSSSSTPAPAQHEKHVPRGLLSIASKVPGPWGLALKGGMLLKKTISLGSRFTRTARVANVAKAGRLSRVASSMRGGRLLRTQAMRTPMNLGIMRGGVQGGRTASGAMMRSGSMMRGGSMMQSGAMTRAGSMRKPLMRQGSIRPQTAAPGFAGQRLGQGAAGSAAGLGQGAGGQLSAGAAGGGFLGGAAAGAAVAESMGIGLHTNTGRCHCIPIGRRDLESLVRRQEEGEQQEGQCPPCPQGQISFSAAQGEQGGGTFQHGQHRFSFGNQ
ncbi:hypothetical protein MCOR25_004374 [Pyricularia grisea]|uniref:Uncharacterized protein n=1 Tax=Pyricularia grisea TaxID=148305 RepID=A0A6P8BHD5_PYRGI|nr:uncharacterized protein PgNI_02202 [Pyricularia grisea]KAI6369745.1 hypothetical protein MCOR25_004374 [Pyricularia grisea]TLD16130.1 hypothetical protein PgNI_02202 [Pyricularia grisea]